MFAEYMVIVFYPVLICQMARGFLLGPPTCYECDFAFHPESCLKTKTCVNDQKCYTERRTAPDQSIVYRLGCISNHACSTSGGTLCFGCCTGSLCNKKICHSVSCPTMRYGPGCTETCGRCLNGGQCDTATGRCPNECEDGFVAPFCKSGCPSPFYGRACSHICGHCSGGSRCNAQTGMCPGSCEKGYLPPLCTAERSIRLVNGLSSLEGRLEIYHGSSWGTVCDDSFTTIAAGVACRQLGFSSEGATFLSSATFGSGGYNIWLDDVSCRGDEMSIQNCQHLGWGSNNCGHNEDVGIRCKRNIRLVGGQSLLEGRLEIFHQNVWGTVCDDGFTTGSAQVACRQLGFSTNGAITYQRAFYGPGSNIIWLDDVGCSGNEATIADCAHLAWGSNNCQHSEDVGIKCTNIVRLTGGGSSMEGRVEIYYKDQWGTVCDDAFTNMGASVVCRMLGFHGSAVFKSGGLFGAGTGQIWLDQVTCTGREVSIADCSHSPWGTHDCSHSEDVGVLCSH